MTEKYGATLNTLGVTLMRYDDGIRSISRSIEAGGKSTDLTIRCVVNCNTTLFLGGMDGFTVKRDGARYKVLANVDSSSVPFDKAAAELDKALSEMLADFRQQQDVDASWKQ